MFLCMQSPLINSGPLLTLTLRYMHVQIFEKKLNNQKYVHFHEQQIEALVIPVSLISSQT